MSTTPRTDAAVISSGFQAVPFGFQEFARSLEIELKEAEQIDNAANHYLSRAEKAEAEVERLFARLYKACDDERDMAISEGLGHGVCGLASELTTRAEKAEAEVAALKRPLLRLTSLWHQLFFLLDITEESDSGNEFRPNRISSCRAVDAERIDKILAEAKQLINANVKNEQP